MKKRWRWPLAGFVLGALAGATVLTVNVVGASRPAPVAVRPAGFGEIPHTPVLLSRAGKSVELSYDVVCGALKDEPRSHCSPSGSVFVRPVGGSTFAKLPLEREADGLLSAVVSAADAGKGFDYYVVMGNGRGRTATLPEAGAEAPQHVWALTDWTTVDVGAAHFGRSRAPSLRPAGALVGPRRRRDWARQRPRAVAHRAIGVRRRARWFRRSARPGEPPARSAAARGSNGSRADRVLGRRGRPRRGPHWSDLRPRLGEQADGSRLHGRRRPRSRRRRSRSRRRT